MGYSNAIDAAWRPAYGMNPPRSSAPPPRTLTQPAAPDRDASPAARTTPAADPHGLAALLKRMADGDEGALATFYDATVAKDPASLIGDADHPRGDDPLDLLAAVEACSALHGALAVLPPAPRQMVALAFFRGMTHEEIAAHAALPLGTVKSQIRRALDVLRRTLATADGAVR